MKAHWILITGLWLSSITVVGCGDSSNSPSIEFPISGTVVREPLFTATGNAGDYANVEVWVEKDGVVVSNGQNVVVSDKKWSADLNMLLNPYANYRIYVKEVRNNNTVSARAAVDPDSAGATVDPNSEEALTADIATNFDSQVIVLTGTDIDTGALFRNLTSQEILIVRGHQPDAYFYGDTFLLVPTDPNDLNLPEDLPADFYMAYDDLSFRIKGTAVQEITILADTYSLVNGLTIGSTLAAIEEAFGTDYKLTEQDGANRYFVSYKKLGVMFEVLYADDTASEVNVIQVQY